MYFVLLSVHKTPVSVAILLKVMLRCSFTFIKYELILLLIHGLCDSATCGLSHTFEKLWVNLWMCENQCGKEDRKEKEKTEDRKGPSRGPPDGMKGDMKKNPENKTA